MEGVPSGADEMCEYEADMPCAPGQAPPPVPAAATATPKQSRNMAPATPHSAAQPTPGVARDISSAYDASPQPLDLPQPPGMSLHDRELPPLPSAVPSVSPAHRDPSGAPLPAPVPTPAIPASIPGMPGPPVPAHHPVDNLPPPAPWLAAAAASSFSAAGAAPLGGLSTASPVETPERLLRSSSTGAMSRRRTKSHQYFANLSAGLSADGQNGARREKDAQARRRQQRGGGPPAVLNPVVEGGASVSQSLVFTQHMQTQDQMIKELGLELSVANERYTEAKRALEGTLEASQNNNLNLVARLREANARIDTLEKLRDDDRVKWLATVESWKSHLDETDQKAQKDRETLELRLSAYEQSIQFSDDLSSLLQKSESRGNTLQQELEESKALTREEANRSQQLGDELEVVRKELLGALSEQTHSSDQSALLQSMVTSLRAELSKSSVEKDSLQSRVEGLHENIERLSGSLAATTGELEQQRENHAMVLDRCQVEFRTEVQALRGSQEHELNKLRRELEIRAEQYEDEIGGLRHDLVTQTHSNENEVAALQREFDSALSRVRAQHQQEKRLDSDMIESLKSEIKDLEAKTQETLHTMDSAQSHADAKVFAKSKEVHDLNTQMANLRQALKSLESENQVLIRNQAFLETQLEDLQTKQREDTSKLLHGERLLVAAQEREAGMKGQIAEAEAKNAVLHERLTGLLTEHEHVNAQLTQAHRKLDHVKSSISMGERQVKRQQGDTERLREECIMKDAVVEELRAKVVSQQMDVQQLRMRLVEASLHKPGRGASSAAHTASVPPSVPRSHHNLPTPSAAAFTPQATSTASPARCGSLTSPDPSVLSHPGLAMSEQPAAPPAGASSPPRCSPHTSYASHPEEDVQSTPQREAQVGEGGGGGGGGGCEAGSLASPQTTADLPESCE